MAVEQAFAMIIGVVFMGSIVWLMLPILSDGRTDESGSKKHPQYNDHGHGNKRKGRKRPSTRPRPRAIRHTP